MSIKYCCRVRAKKCKCDFNPSTFDRGGGTMGITNRPRRAASIAVLAATAALANDDCPMVLAPSPVAGGGLGVFSGRAVPKGKAPYEICPSIAVPYSATEATALNHYVFGFNDTHATVSFGLAMMYNHSPRPHLHNQWTLAHERRNAPKDDGPVDVAFRPTDRAVARYEEVFDSYGGEQWFGGRGIDYKDADAHETATAFPPGVLPGCGGTDVDVVEWVAVATKAYAVGDVVEVSRGLVLPLRRFDGTLLREFLLPLDGDLALLLLGKGAIYVGDGNDRGDAPNLELHPWPDAAETPASLAAAFRRAGAEEQGTILVAATAATPISPGDKLTLDRGAWGLRSRAEDRGAWRPRSRGEF